MPEEVRRGYSPSDEKEFGTAELERLRAALRDAAYLIGRGYGAERAVTFIGDRFQFSARQRAALLRAAAPAEAVRRRREKLRAGSLRGETVSVDAFNCIIPLEIALSRSTLLLCMDGTVRDLAGLHGTYRVIDKTAEAIRMLGRELERREAARAVFYLDAPVSNSGRLAALIRETLAGFSFFCEARIVPDADPILWQKDFAATSDAVILDHCPGWVNLVRGVLRAALPGYPLLDLSGGADF